VIKAATFRYSKTHPICTRPSISHMQRVSIIIFITQNVQYIALDREHSQGDGDKLSPIIIDQQLIDALLYLQNWRQS